MRGIAILQNAWSGPVGWLGEVLDEYAIDYRIINVEEEPLPGVDECTALIALGGTQHVYDIAQYPYMIAEAELIHQAVTLDIPYLGVCLGGQLLAHAIGGRVRRHDVIETGFVDVFLTDEGKQDPLLRRIPAIHKVFHWHEDTFDLPVEAHLLEKGYDTVNQAFRYGKRAYGLQYHIELNDNVLDTWMYHPEMKESMLEDIGEEAYVLLQKERVVHHPVYLEQSRILVENFLCICGLLERKEE